MRDPKHLSLEELMNNPIRDVRMYAFEIMYQLSIRQLESNQISPDQILRSHVLTDKNRPLA